MKRVGFALAIITLPYFNLPKQKMGIFKMEKSSTGFLDNLNFGNSAKLPPKEQEKISRLETSESVKQFIKENNKYACPLRFYSIVSWVIGATLVAFALSIFVEFFISEDLAVSKILPFPILVSSVFVFFLFFVFSIKLSKSIKEAQRFTKDKLYIFENFDKAYSVEQFNVFKETENGVEEVRKYSTKEDVLKELFTVLAKSVVLTKREIWKDFRTFYLLLFLFLSSLMLSIF